MKYIYSVNPPAIAKENPVFTTDIKGTLEMMLEDHKASDLVVCTEDYFEAKTAIKAQVKLIFKGTLIKPAEVKTMLSKALFLFSCASTPTDVLDSQNNLKAAVMAAVPSQMPEAKAIKIISDLCDTAAKKDVLQRINMAFIERRKEVKAKISFNNDGLNVIAANYQNGQTQEFILSNDGIHIVNGEKGTGKSEMMINIFKAQAEAMSFPIFVNSSRALAESMVDKDIEKYFYRNILANREAGTSCVAVRKAILGVINTVMMNGDLEPQRARAKTFMVDEIEEVLNHMSGKAVGKGGLDDQAFIFSQFEKQMQKAEKVIITDAMMSQETIDMIKKASNGKPIYVHNQKSSFEKPKVKYMPEAMNMAETKCAIEQGKVGVFCDGAHSEIKSKVNAVVEALGKGNRYQLIDANFMSEREKAAQLKDRSEFSKSNDIIFYNSAAKCGLSIKDEEYKTVSLMACMTVSPNELVQASARFRMANTILLSFDKKLRFREPTNDYGVASKIMLSETNPSEITPETLGGILKDENKSKVVKRIAYKNQMRQDYINTTLIMLEEMGYDVEYVERDEEKERTGRSTRKQGTDAEKLIRIDNVIKAQLIDDKEAMQIRQNGEHSSQHAKNMLESYNLRSNYNVPAVTQELMEFDAEGKGRRLIENMKIARDKNGRSQNAEGLIKEKMFKKFFELVDICPVNFGRYSAINADAFQEFLIEGHIEINDKMTLSAQRAFEIAFKDCNLCHKSSMKTVSGILKTVFNIDKPENIGVRIRKKYVYEAKPKAINEKYYEQAIAK